MDALRPGWTNCCERCETGFPARSAAARFCPSCRMARRAERRLPPEARRRFEKIELPAIQANPGPICGRCGLRIGPGRIGGETNHGTETVPLCRWCHRELRGKPWVREKRRQEEPSPLVRARIARGPGQLHPLIWPAYAGWLRAEALRRLAFATENLEREAREQRDHVL